MKYVLGALTMLLFTGCSYTHPLTIAPMSLGPKEHAIGMAKGTSTATYLLGFSTGDDATLAGAVLDAQTQAGRKGATLVNVFADEKEACFPACWFALYREVTIGVFGTLVDYDFQNLEQKQKPSPAGAM